MQKPKKPTLNSIREKRFSDLINKLEHHPHDAIVKSIDLKRFSLDENDLYKYKPEILAKEEYVRCLDLFERRMPVQYSLNTNRAIISLMNQLSIIYNSIFELELKHGHKLKNIATNTIRSLFDVPEHIVILPEIQKDLSVNHQEQNENSNITLSLDSDEEKELIFEIKKREILNGITHGSSIHIWKSCHYIIKEQIDELDPMLMNLYDQYTASIGWLLWQTSPEHIQSAINNGNSITQGFNELKFNELDEPECNIYCYAINFPVLLHEITKGVIDYLISKGIPMGYSPEKLKYYYAKADSYENEFFHYLLSPTIWTKFVEACDLETQSLPYAISKLTELNYLELSEVLKSCIDGVEEGRNKLKEKGII